MREFDFKLWLYSTNVNKKVASDLVSRLKQLELELSLDIDLEFEKDHCTSLLTVFCNTGKNEAMAAVGLTSLPIGKYYLSSYKYSLKKYINFLEK